jgi:uncharacterized protein YbjT (DUF2867 family)
MPDVNADQMSERDGLLIAVLGASGLTGRELTKQALERGHRVVALVRDPGKLDLPPHRQLTIQRAEVHDHDAMQSALVGADAVVSGLGTSRRQPDTLATAAKAVVDAGVPRILWLGSVGSNDSAGVAGPLWRTVVRALLSSELADKRDAEQQIRDAGGTIVHAGPLTNAAPRGARAVPLSDAPRRLVPRRISRADVASVMLDQAVAPTALRGTVVMVAAK